MKQNEIKDSSVNQLRTTNFANVFNVYLNEQGKYFYNLINTIYIPQALEKSLYTSVFPLPGEYLPQFSYRMYKTIDLAWLIAETNKINNMLEPLSPNSPLRVLNDDVVRNILLRLKIGE